MALLDASLAQLFGAALGGLYRPATLHRVTQARVRGGSTVETVVDLACRAQIDSASEAMQPNVGAGDREVRILVLAASLAGTVTTADRISVGGDRYAVVAVDRDPAAALFDLRARRD